MSLVCPECGTFASLEGRGYYARCSYCRTIFRLVRQEDKKWTVLDVVVLRYVFKALVGLKILPMAVVGIVVLDYVLEDKRKIKNEWRIQTAKTWYS